MLVSVFSTFKVQSFKISQRMIFRIKAHVWRALAELRNTTQHMGGIKQAGRAVAKISFFYCQCSSLSSAETLQLKRQPSTRVFAGALPGYSRTAFSWKPDIFCQFGSAYWKLWVSEKKTCTLQKGVFTFSARRGYKKSIQAFSIKINTCREEKEVVIMALSQHTESLVEDIRAGTQIWVSVLQIILF